MTAVIKEYPRSQQIHVVLDNLSTHDGADVNEWLQKHPNVTFHFTPTGASWINQVETFFGIITRQAIRRGDFRSVAHLVRTIGEYIEHWNEDAKPFEWKATAGLVPSLQVMVHSRVNDARPALRRGSVICIAG